MKKCIVLLLVTLFIIPCCQPSYAFWWKKKKKTETSGTEAPKTLSKYEKLFDGKKSESAKGNFITIHKIDGKLYFEFPLKYIGKEMLLASTVAASTDNTVGTVGYKPTDPAHIKFTMKDSTVYLRKIKTDYTYDPSVKASGSISDDPDFMHPAEEKFKLEAYNQDSTAVVFEVTPLFTTDVKYLRPIADYVGYFSVNAILNPKFTSLGEIKAFDDNVTINTTFSYNYNVQVMGMSIGTGDATIKATRTLLLLPEEKMRPRISDSRIGVFLTEKKHLTSGDPFKDYSVAHRWRLEPKDMEAYKRGELVEPKKPVIFYLDDAFPQNWKEPAREGALRWNKAFEKIGFKNVIQVVNFPKNDPEFDPANLKYSCILYTPVAIENAMGPSWVDPTTGEIINASVLVYNDLIKLINSWRFVQTAHIDPRVRNKKMPDDVVKESIAYAVAHEVGHTLGLMHNMTASAAYPVDSLRSATFTQKYGTTPSIMDYARFNYVAQIGDKGVRLLPPDIGLYDEYAIKWLYKPVPEAKTLEEETAIVSTWIDEKAGGPIYRYGKQQVLSRFDPSALEEDLGDDPIKAADYGIKNLKYILAHINEWIKDDPTGDHRARLYEGIAMQYYRYLTNVFLNIGGIYLSEVNEGTPGVRKRPVPKEIQKASLKWLFKQVRSADWLSDPKIMDKLPLDIPMNKNMVHVIDNLFGSWTPSKVALSSSLFPDAYPVHEFYNDLYNEIWDSTLKGRTPSGTEQFIQTTFFNGMKDLMWIQNGVMAGFTSNTLPVSTSSCTFAPTVEEICLYGLDQTGMTQRYKEQLQNIQSRYGTYPIAAQMHITNFGSGYNWQRMIDIQFMDQKPIYLVNMVQKSIQLMKTKIPSATGNTKVHYQSMLLRLEKLLDKMQY